MGAAGSTAILERLSRPKAPVLVEFCPEPLFAKRSEPVSAASPEVSFGPFRLLPTQFLLLENGKPVPVGSRALEILIVLLGRPGELVSKQELMARVWPNTFVEPANLTVHISALRRALRDGKDGNRFIINIPGRGYSFVASVEYRDTGTAREQPPRGTHGRRFLESTVSPDAAQPQIRFTGPRTLPAQRRSS